MQNNKLKLFALTFASKLAAEANGPKPESTTAMGTPLFGKLSEAYVQTWDEAGNVTGLAKLNPLDPHQVSLIPSDDDPPKIGQPYLSALVHEANGVLKSLVLCRWDALAPMMCTDPTYSNLRKEVRRTGVDGYHVARFLGTLAPKLASGGGSQFDANLFAPEIARMANLEKAIAKKNASCVLTTPAKTTPTVTSVASVASWGMSP